MKKRLIFIFLIGITLLIPIKAKAASVSVALNCPSSAKSGTTISCAVKVTSDVLVTGLSGKYTLGSNFTYVSFTPASNFTTYSSSASGFAIGNTSGKKGTFTVGTIKLKVNSAGTFTLHSLDASDSSYNSYSPASKSASVRIKSTNNSLKTLTLSTGKLSPSFSSSVTSYKSTIDASSVTISATKGDSYQTITGTGKKTLNYGTNTFNIVVTSESGSKKTYTIVITRPDNRSTNNNLSSLSLSQGNISFNKNTTSYNVAVASNITSIKVNATLSDSKSSFISGYGNRTVNLNYGKNTIQVKVKAENGSIKTYTINVTRKDDRSTNNYLKELKLSSGDIVFNKDILEYDLTVYYDVSKIDVEAIVEDSKAKVVVNSPTLNVGNNVITITVTAENGNARTYKIVVKRLSEDEKMSDNNDITSLKVLGHEIDFKKDVLEYDITIKDEYALVFEISLEDAKANYVIEGNEDLKDGSIIKIISTSESGLQKEYKFNIIKSSKKAETSSWIYLGIGFLTGIVFTVLLFFIKRKISKPKEKM